MYNKLLQRQLQKFIGDKAIPFEYLEFLKTISASYDHFEQDRLMLERAIEISSAEMLELNKSERKAHEEIKALFHNIEEVFFSINFPEFKLMQISPACLKVFGYTNEEFFAHSNLWIESVVQEDKPIISQLFMSERSTAKEYRIICKDGSVKWVETKISISKDRAGNLCRIDGVTSDIEKRKKAELNLNIANENLQITIDRLTDAQRLAKMGSWMHIVDTDTFVRSAEFYKIYELAANDYPESFTEYLNLIHPDDRQHVNDMYNEAIKSKKSYQYEARLLVKGGRIKYIQSIGKPVIDAAGNLSKVHGTVQDVTNIKKTEEELRKNVMELTKSNRELDSFVYSVSHDLRAPLSSMLGIIEISEEDTNDELMLDHLGMLKNNINKLDGFISDILDYSRNSRSEVIHEHVDFNSLMEEVISNLKFIGGSSRPVDIAYHCDITHEVYSDRTRLFVILNNLVSNAIRYQNPEEEKPFAHIQISATQSELKLTVKDNGIGIKAEHQSKIFEMFFRVSTNSVGSGLGLYIVAETIKRLNGSIQLKSKENNGTCFTIKIPNTLKVKSN